MVGLDTVASAKDWKTSILNIYRYTSTGVFGYVGYDGEREICAVSSVACPNQPVYITGENFRYVSCFDMDTTLLPGFTTRLICEESSGQVKAKLRWEDRGSYTLIFNSEQFHIHCADHHYIFSSNEKEPLLVMKRASKGKNVPEHILSKYDWCDVELRFELSSRLNFTIEQMAVFAAVPMLEFGL